MYFRAPLSCKYKYHKSQHRAEADTELIQKNVPLLDLIDLVASLTNLLQVFAHDVAGVRNLRSYMLRPLLLLLVRLRVPRRTDYVPRELEQVHVLSRDER